MISRKSLLFLLTLFLTICLPLSGVWSEVIPEITGIDVREVDGRTEIAIDSTATLDYTIYKSDPYSINVEFQGASLGNFKEKMVIDRAGVMEIIPSTGEGTNEEIKLVISLTVPVNPEPVQEGNSLVIAFVNPEADDTEEVEDTAVVMEVAGGADTINSIDVGRAGDRLLVTITGNGPMTSNVFQSDNNKLILDIPDIISSVEAPTVFEPPVKGIRIGQYTDKARIVFDIDESAEYDVSSAGMQVIVSFNISGEVPVSAAMEETMLAGKEETADEVAVEYKTSPCQDEELIRRKIDLDYQDADLTQALTFIADMSDGCNIVVSQKIKEKITIKLKDVPWGRALDAILRNYGLDKRVDGNIMRIATTSALSQEESARAKAKESQEKAGNLTTEFYPINFAQVGDVEKSIKGAKILTKRGSISIDERTSILIIKDVEDNHPKYAKLIARLDKPEKQVSINARIVEVNTNFVRDLGIQWGGDVSPSANTKVQSFSGDGSGFATGNPFVVNLPAAVGQGSGGAIGFGYLGAGALRALDIQLSAMESSGNGKIISNPRIITMNNEMASISQGKKIPYQSIDEGTISTTFVDATLTLNVTPHITPDGTVLLEVDIQKDEADFSRSINGEPPIDTTNAETRVLIRNGDTLVIGGIFKETKTEADAGVPTLMDVPVLKWLFKKKLVNQETTELMIFITPQVIAYKK